MPKKQITKKIEEIAGKIAKTSQPEKIILFGSWAWGKPNKDSDLDFLVIKVGADKYHRRDFYLDVMKKVPHELPMDVLFYSPEEINKRLFVEDPFIEKIIKEGKVVYGT